MVSKMTDSVKHAIFPFMNGAEIRDGMWDFLEGAGVTACRKNGKSLRASPFMCRNQHRHGKRLRDRENEAFQEHPSTPWRLSGHENQNDADSAIF